MISTYELKRFVEKLNELQRTTKNFIRRRKLDDIEYRFYALNLGKFTAGLELVELETELLNIELDERIERLARS
jgi:hypothetical protein